MTDILKKITDFFKFEDTTDQPLKYKNKDIITLTTPDGELEKLANKIDPGKNPELKDKLEAIIKKNDELRKEINDVLNSKVLTDESNTALETMYLELLRAEIRIILRDIIEIREKGKEVSHDVKELFEVLTKKFNAINKYLETEKNAPTTTDKPIISGPLELVKTVGGSRNSNRVINYCKYIKYKIKYENLKHNI
jgi:hypothetical protein